LNGVPASDPPAKRTPAARAQQVLRRLLGEDACLRQHELRQSGVAAGFDDAIDGAQGRHEKRTSLGHQQSAFLIDQMTVLDRIDAGANCIFGTLRTDRVRGTLHSVAMRLIDPGPKFVLVELADTRNGPLRKHASDRNKFDAFGPVIDEILLNMRKV
jgi:hypothetical protein